MKKVLSIAFFTLSVSVIFAQQSADSYIKEAQTFISQKNYKEAQSSLQMAMNELNNMMCKDILASLPKEIDGLKADVNSDETNSAAMGMLGGGFSLTRSYKSGGEKSVKLTITGNSPMLASMNMMLSNPAYLQGSNQKMIRIGTLKGILDFKAADKNGNINIPMGSSLATIDFDDFADEASITAFVTKLNLENVKKYLGE